MSHRRRFSTISFDESNIDSRLRVGLQAHWGAKGCNRSLLDMTGYGRHAIAGGSPSDARRVISWSAGRNGTPCPEFLGNVFASYDLAHTNAVEMSTSGFTIASWVYMRGTNAIQMIMSKYPGYYLYVDGNVNRVSFTHGGADHFTASNTIKPNEWVHLAGTHDGNTAWKLYINGVETVSGNQALSGTGSAVSIGNYGLTYPLTGKIDDLRIYNRALSQPEVLLLTKPIVVPSLISRKYVASASSGPINLKTYNTNLKANIKSINTVLLANIKKVNTLS